VLSILQTSEGAHQQLPMYALHISIPWSHADTDANKVKLATQGNCSGEHRNHTMLGESYEIFFATMRSIHRGFGPLALTALCILILRRRDEALGPLDCKLLSIRECSGMSKGHNLAGLPHLHAITPGDKVPNGVVAPHM